MAAAAKFVKETKTSTHAIVKMDLYWEQMERHVTKVRLVLSFVIVIT